MRSLKNKGIIIFIIAVLFALSMLYIVYWKSIILFKF